MTISPNHVWSDLPVSPGTILEEVIEAKGMTQKELAGRMGRPPQVVNEIIRAKKAITPETALELEKVLGMSAQLWVNLEAVYRMTLARNQERARLEREAASLSGFPVREMEKRGWIPKFREKADQARAVLEFLGIASFREPWSQTAAAFRITGGVQFSPEALGVWLKKGEIDGQSITTSDYDRAKFLSAIEEVRFLTSEPPEVFLPGLTELFADAGVAFVITKEFPKSGANGAARWIGPKKALIQLSLKWKWADVFWFTVFHEAGHILSHEHRNFVEGIPSDADNRTEDQANQFAANSLIPEQAWNTFVENHDWSGLAVRQFSEGQGIAPGIVVGRMHHEKVLPYSQLTALKQRFVWIDAK